VATERVWGGLTTTERETRRREQLLEAGLELFGTRGWTGTTVLHLCRAAKLSQRYFYDHFPSREALFLAVVDRVADEVEAVVRAAVSGGVTGVLDALAAHLTADPRLIRVTLVESFATAEFRARRARLIATFSAVAADLMATLAPPDADPRRIQLSALILSGGVAEALVAASEGAPPASADELVAHLTLLYTAAAQL
jgi:AcrR family transcriptional regulator